MKNIAFSILAIFAVFALCSCDSAKPPYKSAGGALFTQKGANKWAYKHDPAAKQRMWAASFGTTGTQGKELVGKMTLTADKPVRAVALLGRSRVQDPFEGTSESVTLQPGVPAKIEVSHKFKANHSDVKLQFDVVECNSPTVEFTIDDISLSESPAR